MQAKGLNNNNNNNIYIKHVDTDNSVVKAKWEGERGMGEVGKGGKTGDRKRPCLGSWAHDTGCR